MFALIAFIAGSALPVVSGSTVTTAADAKTWLDNHNYHRCMHGANPVYWDDDLAAKAQTWAVHLASIKTLVHSNSYSIWPFSGENLAWGQTSIANAITAWYSEYQNWQCNGNWTKATGTIGHFSALAWKGINRIGCGVSNNYYVCEYGNVACRNNTTTSSFGGVACWGGDPSRLANFNEVLCTGDGTNCVGCLAPANSTTCSAASNPIYDPTPTSTTTTTTKNPLATSTTVKPSTASTTVKPSTASTTVKPSTASTTTTTKALSSTSNQPSSASAAVKPSNVAAVDEVVTTDPLEL